VADYEYAFAPLAATMPVGGLSGTMIDNFGDDYTNNNDDEHSLRTEPLNPLSGNTGGSYVNR
jgi:hypothetical protein